LRPLSVRAASIGVAPCPARLVSSPARSVHIAIPVPEGEVVVALAPLLEVVRWIVVGWIVVRWIVVGWIVVRWIVVRWIVVGWIVVRRIVVVVATVASTSIVAASSS